MSRAKTILWVDDEAESLEAHVLFLSENDYSVERVTNGDDAVAMLQRQSYGVVLLDEQMPGKRGLDLVPEFRALDPGVPIVMVTKSEAADTMRAAIGAELDDYLVKPVNPRQVLTVVTRLTEGDRIRQQHRARDFVTRFRELEERRASDLGWREWVELVAELAFWEVKLSGGDDSGLQEALSTYQTTIQKDFADFVARDYPSWIADVEDRPPLSHDVVSEFLAPVYRQHEKALFIVLDCLRLDQWEMLKPIVASMFDVEVSHHFSILPTATPYSRNAIFSGLLPVDIQERYPDWWTDREDRSLNAHEKELLEEQMADLLDKKVPVHYEKLHTAGEGEALLKKLSGYLSTPGVTSLVFNFVDQLTHGRSDNEILFEVARDAAALRSLTRTWFTDSPLMGALKEADRRRVPVILTTDHGSIHCHSPATVFAKRDATSHLRYKFGEDLRAKEKDTSILVEDLPAWGLPARKLGVRMLLAREDRFFVYPTKLREYQQRYRGAFLHGGISPEEMIVPVVLLNPRG